MQVLVVDPQQQVVPMEGDAFLHYLRMGQVAPTAAASVDGGRSFMAAWQLASRLHSRGNDALALLVPGRTEPWSAAAGYVAIFSFLFFGGPLAFGAGAVAFEVGDVGAGPTRAFRLGFLAAGILLGPLPIAALAELGRRALRRDPTYRGKGRMVFAYVIAAVLVLPCIVGLVGIVVR